MTPQLVLAACLAAFTHAGESAQVYRLANVGAADAAEALRRHAAETGAAVTLLVDPVSNSIAVAGAPAQRARAGVLLAGLDRRLPQVLVQLTAVRVPGGFPEQVGLGERSESQWVLTAREAKLLHAALRFAQDAPDPAARPELLTRPQLILTDNQPGVFQVGGGPVELTVRVVPRREPGGAALRMQADFTAPSPGFPAFDVQSIGAAASVPFGSALAMRGAVTKAAGSATVETLIVATVTEIK